MERSRGGGKGERDEMNIFPLETPVMGKLRTGGVKEKGEGDGQEERKVVFIPPLTQRLLNSAGERDKKSFHLARVSGESRAGFCCTLLFTPPYLQASGEKKVLLRVLLLLDPPPPQKRAYSKLFVCLSKE